MSFVRSIRCVCRVAPRVLAAVRPAMRPAQSINQTINRSSIRSFQTSRVVRDSHVAPPPSKAEVEARVFDVVKKFDKVDPAAVTAASTFKELGLDSLDGVEIVMALEDEFSIEVNDADAEKIQSVQSAIDFISQQPNIK